MGIIDQIVAVALPGRCAGCGTRAPGLCPACVASAARPPALPPPPGIDWWTAAFAYDGAAREAVARVKYRNERAAVTMLAGVMAAVVEPVLAMQPVDVITWVPTTNAHRRTRGFDHAELLANALARALRVPVRSTLQRIGVVAQTGRTRAARRGDPPRFRARGRVPARVLLVDDVVTTGTTARSAATALRSAGAARVAVVTAARTPPDRRG